MALGLCPSSHGLGSLYMDGRSSQMLGVAKHAYRKTKQKFRDKTERLGSEMLQKGEFGFGRFSGIAGGKGSLCLPPQIAHYALSLAYLAPRCSNKRSLPAVKLTMGEEEMGSVARGTFFLVEKYSAGWSLSAAWWEVLKLARMSRNLGLVRLFLALYFISA